MKGKLLSVQQTEAIAPGEALTLSAVMTILCIGVMAVVIFQLFTSQKGNVKLPGGFGFDWK